VPSFETVLAYPGLARCRGARRVCPGRPVDRRLAGKTYKEIAKDLDLTKDYMRNCARIARLMEEAGIPEPYHRLTEKPDRVSQWCSKHWLKAGDRKGGGKRRRAS